MDGTRVVAAGEVRSGQILVYSEVNSNRTFLYFTYRCEGEKRISKDSMNFELRNCKHGIAFK